MSRPRCDDRAPHASIDCNGNFSDAVNSDITRVYVVNGVIETGVTQGKLKAWLRDGAVVTEHVFGKSETPESARALVSAHLSSGDPPQWASVQVDSFIVGGRAASLVAGFRSNPRPLGLTDTDGISDAVLWRWSRVVEEFSSVAIFDVSQEMLPLLSYLPDSEWLAAVVLIREFSQTDVLAMVKVPDLVQLTLRAPRTVHCWLALTNAGVDISSWTDTQLVAGAALLSRFSPQDVAQLVASSDRRTLIRLVAGWSGENDDWPEFLEKLWRDDPALAQMVLDTALGGTVRPAALLRLLELNPRQSLGLSPGTLAAVAAQLVRDGSVTHTDSALFAARVISIFGKRAPDFLQQATKAGWDLHAASALLPVDPSASYKGLSEFILSAGFTTWDSPYRSRTAVFDVVAAWPTMGEQLKSMSLRQATKFIRTQSLLGSAWHGTGLGEVVGEVSTVRDEARRAASLWLVSQIQPSVFPTMKFSSSAGRVLSGEFLSRTAGEHLFFGHLTDCCQRLGGAASECAIDSQANPTSTLFVVRDSQGKVIAGSWVWLAHGTDAVCFDNIEYLEGSLSAEEKVELIAGLRSVYGEAAEELARRWGVDVHVGQSYTDSSLLEGLPKVSRVSPRGYQESSSHVYSDASTQFLLAGAHQKHPGAWRPVSRDSMSMAWSDGVREVALQTSLSGNTLHISLSDSGGFAVSDLHPQELAALVESLRLANPHATITANGEVLVAGSEIANLSELASDVGVSDMFLSAQVDSGFSAVTPAFLAECMIYGFVNKEDVLLLSERGVSSNDLNVFASKGISSASEVVRLMDLGLSPPRLRDYPLDDIAEIERLFSVGVSGHDFSSFSTAGIASVDEMLIFKSAGVSGTDALGFSQAGVSGVESMRSLLSKGLSGEVAASYASLDITNVDDMLLLSQAGIFSPDIIHYNRGGIKSPNEMVALLQLGISGEDAHSFSLAGIYDVDSMSKLRDMGMSGRDAEAFSDFGIKDVAKMIEFHNEGLPGFWISQYKYFNIDDFSLMLDLAKAGVSPEQVNTMRFVGIHDAQVLIEVVSAGVSMTLFESLARHDIVSAKDVILFHTLGVSARDLNSYINFGVADPQLIHDLLHASVTPGMVRDFMASDPSREMSREALSPLLNSATDESPVRLSHSDQQKLRDSGIPLLDIVEFSRIFSDPTDVAAAIDNGISAEGARIFIDLGYQLRDMVAFGRMHIQASEVASYHQAGFCSLDEIQTAKQAGVSGWQAVESVKMGASTLEEMKKIDHIFI